MDKPLEQKDVIRRLCELQSEVRTFIGDGSAADCFCGEQGYWGADGYDGTFDGGYRNDGRALEFIELAVRKALSSGVSGETEDRK